MTWSGIEEILGGTIGLNAASIGRDAIELAVRVRMRACGIERADDYLPRLHASADELDELIEAIVVPETWFFRHPESFAALSESIRDKSLQGSPQALLRVLSAPSSTGEEPYSIAMTLLDAGIPPDQFCVDAVDISRKALAGAERAVFGSNAFRSVDLSFRDRYFRGGANGYHLSEVVRKQVRFRCVNLLAPDFLQKGSQFDVIFCRNVLIYFDRQSQQQLIAALDRALAPRGLLFVGPAEGFLVMSSGFRSTLQPMAFAYRKPGLPHSEPAAKAAVTRTKPLPAPVRPSKTVRIASSGNAPNGAPPGAPNAGDLIEARRLADAGSLQESWKQCETNLRRHGPSADAYYLMGLLKDATGDDVQAREFHRKALYLEPRHLEALAHLALLEERKGDLSTAGRLRARIERLEKQSSSESPRPRVF